MTKCIFDSKFNFWTVPIGCPDWYILCFTVSKANISNNNSLTGLMRCVGAPSCIEKI